MKSNLNVNLTSVLFDEGEPNFLKLVKRKKTNVIVYNNSIHSPKFIYWVVIYYDISLIF